LTVRHTVHLNTFRFLGHRTVELHVMHFPLTKSSAGVHRFRGLLDRDSGIYDASSSSSESRKSSFVTFFLTLLDKREGKGWLIERACARRGTGVGSITGTL
jgi:hypothetical protein